MRRMSMRIITDTGALYSPEEGKKLGFDVLPLNVIADKKSYKEYVDISSQEFLEIVKEGHIPSSSQPSIGETMEMFEKYPDEDILVINMADGLSGTYQSTVSAKESVDHSENIHVINSMTLCGPQRYLVEKAVALKEALDPAFKEYGEQVIKNAAAMAEVFNQHSDRSQMLLLLRSRRVRGL